MAKQIGQFQLKDKLCSDGYCGKSTIIDGPTQYFENFRIEYKKENCDDNMIIKYEKIKYDTQEKEFNFRLIFNGCEIKSKFILKNFTTNSQDTEAELNSDLFIDNGFYGSKRNFLHKILIDANCTLDKSGWDNFIRTIDENFMFYSQYE